MLNLRTTGRHAMTWRLLILIAVFAFAGSACSAADLEGLIPTDEPPEAEEEPPAAEDPSEEPSEPADSGDEAEPAEPEAPADDAEAVEPITADDVERVCADEEARATTAQELAPLVGLSPATFESVACSSTE
jgi:hypothetical protein